MSTKKIITAASLFALSVIILFVYPTTAKSTDNENFTITTKDGTALTNVHQVSVSSDAVIVHYFGKEVVEKTMKQPGCVGVRMYYGKQANSKSGFMLVGVDKYGKELAPVVLAGPGGVCPPWCY